MTSARWTEHTLVKGLFQCGDAVTEEQAQELLWHIDSKPWQLDRDGHRLQQYGYIYDKVVQQLDERYLLGVLPPWLTATMRDADLPSCKWTQCSIDEVTPGYATEPGTGCAPCYLPSHVVMALDAPLHLEFVRPGAQLQLTLRERDKLLLTAEHCNRWQYRITGAEGRSVLLTFRRPHEVLPDPNQPCLLNRTPPEIIHKCLQYLQPRHLRNVKQTNRLLHELASSLLQQRVLASWTSYSPYPRLNSGTRFIYINKNTFEVEQLPLVEFSLDHRSCPSDLVFADDSRRVVFGQALRRKGVDLTLRLVESTVIGSLIPGSWHLGKGDSAAEASCYPVITSCCSTDRAGRCYCCMQLLKNDGVCTYLVSASSHVEQRVQALANTAKFWQRKRSAAAPRNPRPTKRRRLA